VFYEKRIGQEVPLDSVGGDFKGYLVRITGGCDKSGFPMKQGVLTSSRVRLLIPRGSLGFQRWRGRKGERRRKSVRGCIVSSDIAALNLIVTKKGEKDIEGLTTAIKPRTLGPKRASKIRKLFNLKKHQDVRKYVIKHQVTLLKKNHPKTIKRGPKIQRLITPDRLRRKNFIHKRAGLRKKSARLARLEFERLLASKKRKTDGTTATTTAVADTKAKKSGKQQATQQAGTKPSTIAASKVPTTGGKQQPTQQPVKKPETQQKKPTTTTTTTTAGGKDQGKKTTTTSTTSSTGGKQQSQQQQRPQGDGKKGGK
jgi:small subunit ribosomal protein S6e